MAANSDRIVVIDDHESLAAGLSELLALQGFDTSYATTGCDGLAEIARFKPDAIVCDIHLTDMTGFEICQRLRANRVWDKVAFVYHTGTEEIPTEQHFGDAFVTYPIDTDQLVAVLRGCILRRQRAPDQKPENIESTAC